MINANCGRLILRGGLHGSQTLASSQASVCCGMDSIEISIPYAIEVTGGGDFDSLKSSLLLNLLLTLAIGLYLYCSPDSRKYFRLTMG
jgi:hypothetical protein